MKNKIRIIVVILSLGFIGCNSQTKSEVDTTNIEEHLKTAPVETKSNTEINQTKENFSSKLRPNEAITLNKTYIDTISFSSYNDDYDYKMIIGKKDGKDVGIIYNWDWQNSNKYNFKHGDLLKVERKMEQIIHPGD